MVSEEATAEKSDWRENILEFQCYFEELGLDLFSSAVARGM